MTTRAEPHNDDHQTPHCTGPESCILFQTPESPKPHTPIILSRSGCIPGFPAGAFSAGVKPPIGAPPFGCAVCGLAIGKGGGPASIELAGKGGMGSLSANSVLPL